MSDQIPDAAGEADDQPKTEQDLAPRPYAGPVDSIADFCKLLKAEFQMVGLNKLVLSARARDQLVSKEFVGKHFMCLEACDIVDAQLDLLRQAANAAEWRSTSA